MLEPRRAPPAHRAGQDHRRFDGDLQHTASMLRALRSRLLAPKPGADSDRPSFENTAAI